MIIIVKKGEINASKIDSPSSSLPSELKKKQITEGKIYSPVSNLVEWAKLTQNRKCMAKPSV